jgi:hypothetical protein
LLLGKIFCTQCNQWLAPEDFRKKKKYNISTRNHKVRICKKCTLDNINKRYHEIYKHDPEFNKKRKNYSIEWHHKNKEKNNERVAKRDHEIRLMCINHYGGSCACCGETVYEFLSIDHINGGGVRHRKALGSNGSKFARWLVKNNFPEGYRILCHNCNQAFGHYGYCPHKNKAQCVDE